MLGQTDGRPTDAQTLLHTVCGQCKQLQFQLKIKIAEATKHQHFGTKNKTAAEFHQSLISLNLDSEPRSMQASS